jgi:gliding motility-associated-like protein
MIKMAGYLLVDGEDFSRLPCQQAKTTMDIMSRLSWSIIILLLLSPALFSQRTTGSPSRADTNAIAAGFCGFDNLLARSRASTIYKAGEDRMNNLVLSLPRVAEEDSIILPVVVHIVREDPRQVADQSIIAALNDLNDGFARRGRYASGKGVDTRIRFCLAKKDPDGGNTSGITRTTSFYGEHLNPLIEDSSMKSLIQWDPARYINIWFINTMDHESFATFSCGQWARSFSTGYTTMPPGGDMLDGIVLTALGNFLIHEMGHYLGLYHTFEGSACTNDDCTTQGDRVCDTPPDASMNSSPCDNPQNSCSTDTLSNNSNGNFTSDVPDQVSNFMDYGNPGCQDEFTKGQADRMHGIIQTQRSGLLQPECEKPCLENITAGFDISNPYPVTGDLVNFSNTSSGTARYEWLVNDQPLSSAPGFSYQFTGPGKYKITLKAFNTAGCYAISSSFLNVNCGVTSRFYPNKRTIASGVPIFPDTILFTNSSVNGISFRWMMSNDSGMAEQVVSTEKDLSYIFNSPATYRLRLIAMNGACSDTTGFFTIPVLDPRQDGIPYLNSVDCFEQNKLRISFYVCNYGYATIPKNVPVSFYDADPRLGNARKIGATFFIPDSITGRCCSQSYTLVIDIHQPGLDNLYAVFNDSGQTMPLSLPNTGLPEANYANNMAVSTGFRFKAAAVPSLATLEPGDTLQLTGSAGPGVVAGFSWSNGHNLSCTNCASPFLVADSTTTKVLMATSVYGCTDTATVDIKVPPANDYRVELQDAQCASGNRVFLAFRISNSFKRGVIPKGLTVSFYNSDPGLGGARLLSPVFVVPGTVFAKEAAFTAFVETTPPGNLFAMVNDDGTTLPVQYPGSNLPEKDYLNNGARIYYAPATIDLLPKDTVVMRKSRFQFNIGGEIVDPASVNWSASPAYTLDCYQCSRPIITMYDSAKVTMQMANKYGCLLTGSSMVKLFPPDMTISIDQVNCYTNTTSLVKFTICSNNNYERVAAGIPVSFYDGPPANSGSRLLSPTFYTRSANPAGCFTYQHIIETPAGAKLFARVNDKGGARGAGPDSEFAETNYDNNSAEAVYSAFRVRVDPADTTIGRMGTVQLHPSATGGVLSSWSWKEDPALSCTRCLAPAVNPKHSAAYILTGGNEYFCTDTAQAIVRTYSSGLLNLPNAFTPNNDGLNDVFYVLAGEGMGEVKLFTVYNRWGEKIFQEANIPANDPGFGWDGSHKGIQAAPGTYVYMVSIAGPDGKQQVHKGTVVLVR